MGIHYATDELKRIFESGPAAPDRRSHDMSVLCPLFDNTWDSIEERICLNNDCEYGTCERSVSLHETDADFEPMESHRYIFEIGQPGSDPPPFPNGADLVEHLAQKVADCAAFKEWLDETDDDEDESDNDAD